MAGWRGWNLRRRTSRVPTCHPAKRHVARGLCGTCYRKDASRPRAVCHPNLASVSRGLCATCLGSVYYFSRQYGVTKPQLVAMCDAQFGACEICGGSTKRGLGLVPDHDHKTGKLRAMLCDRCNTGLGLFRDDPMILAGALAYLERHAVLGVATNG